MQANPHACACGPSNARPRKTSRALRSAGMRRRTPRGGAYHGALLGAAAHGACASAHAAGARAVGSGDRGATRAYVCAGAPAPPPAPARARGVLLPHRALRAAGAGGGRASDLACAAPVGVRCECAAGRGGQAGGAHEPRCTAPARDAPRRDGAGGRSGGARPAASHARLCRGAAAVPCTPAVWRVWVLGRYAMHGVWRTLLQQTMQPDVCTLPNPAMQKHGANARRASAPLSAAYPA